MSASHLLVAIDGGPESDRALDAAIDLAARLGVTLDVAHVVPPSPAEMTSDPPYVRAGKERLEQARARAALRGVEANPILRQDTVVLSLLELIDETAPLLVVVGSHGRSGLKRALLGSVSDTLARHSPAPVLIVPSLRRVEVTQELAWSCADCGHILASDESRTWCQHCGASPARWLSAPITPGRADIAEPAFGEAVGGELTQTQARAPSGSFALAPPGVDGGDVNPELRVRY